MTRNFDRRPGWWWPALAAASMLALSGCGGDSIGSDTGQAPTSPPSTQPPVQPVEPPTPASPPPVATTTLSAYAAARAERATVMGYPEPDAAQRDWVFNDSRERAAALLTWGNDLALPALQAAYVGVVAAAARGDTLAELRHAFPVAPGHHAAMLQTQGVRRTLLARQGTPLLPGFLEATDSFGPLPPLDSWSGIELATWGDGRIAATLHRATGESLLQPDAQSRLVVVDQLQEQASLPASESFDGLFEDSQGGRHVVPMLRWSTGVSRLAGSDFNAVVARVGERYLVKFEATATGPWHWRADVPASLAKLVQAAGAAGQDGLAAGQMVLPRVDMSFTPGNLLGTSVRLAFDEVNADLRGLDGGGTYLRAAADSSRLVIEPANLSVSGRHAVEFRFSERNLYGGGDHGSGFVGQVDVNPSFDMVDCPKRDVDLRPFVLALLDSQRRVLAMAQLSNPPGKLCNGSE